jgi:superfamily I DNA and/or RNA helicase
MPSVGVVTFNVQQRALVESLLRDSGDARLAQALDSGHEGLFVKNLENVQGDERDVIMFSTAFSVNERGVLPLNFGPLNLTGGERRLNVAITWARRQVIVFSSFDPEQLRAEETSSVGVKHLKATSSWRRRARPLCARDRATPVKTRIGTPSPRG